MQKTCRREGGDQARFFMWINSNITLIPKISKNNYNPTFTSIITLESTNKPLLLLLTPPLIPHFLAPPIAPPPPPLPPLPPHLLFLLLLFLLLLLLLLLLP